MERTSDKNSPMVDDQLKKETAPVTHGSPVESRAREDKLVEAAGEDQADITRNVAGSRGAGSGSGGLDSSQVLARSDLATSLQPDVFPADRDALLHSARENQAPDRILGEIRRLPEGRQFENVQSVWEALGGSAEGRS